MPIPTDADIDAAITNICRCGTYPRIREAIRRAARVKAGQEQIAAAPPPGIDPGDAAREVPALRDVRAKTERRSKEVQSSNSFSCLSSRVQQRLILVGAQVVHRMADGARRVDGVYRCVRR